MTDDDRFLIIEAAQRTSGNKLFIMDLTKEDEIRPIIDDYTSNTSLIDNKGNIVRRLNRNEAGNIEFEVP